MKRIPLDRRRAVTGLVLAACLVVGCRPAGAPTFATPSDRAADAPSPGPAVGRATRVVTAASPVPEVTPAAAVAAATTPVPPVDWPELPAVASWTPRQTTPHFAVHAADGEDSLLVATVDRWAPRLEALLATGAARVGHGLPSVPVHVVFTRAYAGRCPARGLASPAAEPPLIMVYVAADTADVQIRAVLAHEMAHHLTATADFVGDGIITEGLANWVADGAMLAWQGYPSWDDAVRDYLARGDYVSLTDATALSPAPGEDCLARRDRVYNIRTAFVGWLIRRHGLARVLAMPATEIPPPAGGEVEEPERRPDYVALTGHDLATLERLWLDEVRHGGLGRWTIRAN